MEEGKEKYISNYKMIHFIDLGSSTNNTVFFSQPFHTELLKWTLPSLNLDLPTNINRRFILNQKQNGKYCRT